MIKAINLGDKNESIKALKYLKERKGVSRYIRIINSNIKELNKIIGKKLLRKMQCLLDPRHYGKLCNQLEEKESITTTDYPQKIFTMHCHTYNIQSKLLFQAIQDT